MNIYVFIRKYRAAAVMAAFHETGQADTFAKKTAVAERSYRILQKKQASLPKTLFSINVLLQLLRALRNLTITLSTS